MATLVVSYSRKDQGLVRAIVSLLKTALRDIEKAVFWDADIQPGDEWFRELQHHIEQAPQLFVFWCHHSAASTEVRREWAYALDMGKRVVPVLLDDTPLSKELAVIHGIDLRQAVRHVALPTPSATAPSATRGRWVFPLAAAGLVVLALGYVLSFRGDQGSLPPPPPSTVSPHGTPPPTPPLSHATPDPRGRPSPHPTPPPTPVPTPLPTQRPSPEPTPPPVTPPSPDLDGALVAAALILATVGGWLWVRSRRRRGPALPGTTAAISSQELVVTAFAPYLTPGPLPDAPPGSTSPRQGT